MVQTDNFYQPSSYRDWLSLNQWQDGRSIILSIFTLNLSTQFAKAFTGPFESFVTLVPLVL